MTTFTAQQILALPMGDNDAHATTIGDYFARLAEQAWIEEEGFSGKRPFGNSGWQHEVYHALVTNKVITGEIDNYGYVEDYDGHAADQIITSVLKFLRKIDWASAQEYKEPVDWYVIYLEVDSSGRPTLTDLYAGGMTEEAAKREAEGNNSDTGDTLWRAIHIPK